MHRCLPVQQHMAIFQIQSGCVRKGQPGSGTSAQPNEVDFEFVASIMSSDITREHAGIGRGWLRIDQRNPCARKTVHTPLLQYKGMGVSASNQDQISGEGQGLHHCPDSQRLFAGPGAIFGREASGGSCRWGRFAEPDRAQRVCGNEAIQFFCIRHGR